MVSETLLLIVIVRETGLRSTLAARLSLAGADLLSARDFRDARVGRYKKRALILITDQAAIDEHDGGWDGLRADPRWLRLVVVSPRESAPSEDPRLIHIQRANAVNRIARLLPEWRAAHGEGSL